MSFTRIEYKDVKEINYLTDLIQQNTNNLSFLEKVNCCQSNSEKKQSAFDTIAYDLEIKLLKNGGFIDKPSRIIKKSKKGEADINFYSRNDSFINDDECNFQKKDQQSKFSNFKCLPLSNIEEFYESILYKQKLKEIIIDENKRKAPEIFNPNDEQQIEKFDEIKKKIKNSIKDLLTNKIQLKEKEQVTIPNVEENKEIQKEIVHEIEVINISDEKEES